MQEADVSKGFFADDVVLLAGSESKLQENLNIYKCKGSRHRNKYS